jgi:hypothetical protein
MRLGKNVQVIVVVWLLALFFIAGVMAQDDTPTPQRRSHPHHIYHPRRHQA